MSMLTRNMLGVVRRQLHPWGAAVGGQAAGSRIFQRSISIGLDWSTILSIAGSIVTGASFLERQPEFMRWRLKRSLETTEFSDTPGANFSALRSDEISFSRQLLERHMVHQISRSNDMHFSLIVGGAAGLGKSVFWENLLRKRPLKQTEDKENPWYGMEGAIRVINLLGCTNMYDFQSDFIHTFNPAPFLPNFTFRPEPTYATTSNMLKIVLPQLTHPLVLYLEDINRIHTYSNDESAQNIIVSLFTIINESGGVIVGNSSVLLANAQFQSLSHTGVRTNGIYFPGIAITDLELIKYAENGGRLYPGKGPSESKVNVVNKLPLWGGNLLVLLGISTNPQFETKLKQQVEDSIGAALSTVTLTGRQQFQYLVNVKYDEKEVVKLRRELLELLVKAETEKKTLRVSDLPVSMRTQRIHHQLAAVDVISFRTEYSETGEPFDLIIPYYPYVLQAFKEIKEREG